MIRCRGRKPGCTVTVDSATVSDDLVGKWMIDSIVDYAVIRLDPQGVVRSWHPGAQQLWQYTTPEALGAPVSTFYRPEDVAAGLLAEELRTATHTGRYQTEGWRVRKDGTAFWASVVLTPIRDRAGTVHGFVTVVRDLTGQRDRDRELHATRQMLDAHHRLPGHPTRLRRVLSGPGTRARSG